MILELTLRVVQVGLALNLPLCEMTEISLSHVLSLSKEEKMDYNMQASMKHS